MNIRSRWRWELKHPVWSLAGAGLGFHFWAWWNQRICLIWFLLLLISGGKIWIKRSFHTFIICHNMSFLILRLQSLHFLLLINIFRGSRKPLHLPIYSNPRASFCWLKPMMIWHLLISKLVQSLCFVHRMFWQQRRQLFFAL